MYKINDIVKLNDGKEVKIINLPTTFMSNGSYEVSHLGKKFWVNPQEILYQVDVTSVDDINQYLEIIWAEGGLNLIPKGLESVNIESDGEGFNTIILNYNDGRKHNRVNIHVGVVSINDDKEITIRPKKKKKNKLKKIMNIIKDKEDEI